MPTAVAPRPAPTSPSMGARSVISRALMTASVLVVCSKVRTGSQPTASTSSAPTATFSSRLRWVAACCARPDRWSRQSSPPALLLSERVCLSKASRSAVIRPAMSSRSRLAALFALEVGSAAGLRFGPSGSGAGLTEAKAIAGCGPSASSAGAAPVARILVGRPMTVPFCCLLWLARSDAMRAMHGTNTLDLRYLLSVRLCGSVNVGASVDDASSGEWDCHVVAGRNGASLKQIFIKPARALADLRAFAHADALTRHS